MAFTRPSIDRRRFLAAMAAALPLSACAGLRRDSSRKEGADVVVLGGGLGGCAAALAAARQGRSVILVEPDLWLGGQLTSQGVPADENWAIETGGATASYRELRTRIRLAYRSRGLTEAALGNDRLNPGGGFVSRICCEPRVALAALDSMLSPEVDSGRLTLMLGHRWIDGDVVGDRIRSVTVEDGSGERSVLTASMFLDASEEGDVLELFGVEHVVGAEARATHNEPSAPESANARDQQAATWCFAMEHREGEDHVGDPPAGWDRWRSFVPDLSPPWTGPQYSLLATHPITLDPRQYAFLPPARGQSAERTQAPNLFGYRQIVDPRIYGAGGPERAVTLVNWPQNDAMVSPFYGPGVGKVERARALEEARQVSLGLLHWLRTECPRPDGGQGWPGLALRPDLMGTQDGLARRPYIREARRIRAAFTVTERHVSPALRSEGADGKRRAESFPDTCGIGHYRIDLHPSTAGRNYVDIDCLPFEIPFGALVPERVENLLSAGKSMGTTHITNGAYRLHPVEWGAGEAAGVAAAFCLESRAAPRAILEDPARLAKYQSTLVRGGAILRWA